MGVSLLQIWLLACVTYYVFSSQVIRREGGDSVSPTNCLKSCKQYDAACRKKDYKSKCCINCICNGVGKTFYKKNATQSCVTPNNVEGCKYHLAHKKDWVKVDNTVILLGMLNHREVKLFSYTCSIMKRQYWNLRKWKDFDIYRKGFEIYKKTDYYIKLNIPGKNISSYEGQLIKLDIKCTISNDVADSCIILKILGKRNYTSSVDTTVIVPTEKTKTTKTPKTEKRKTQKPFLIILIIAVTAVILLVIGALVICWCWKKRRKSAGHGEKELLNYGEDPNYQNTDRFSVRHSTEVHNSANNLTYLTPVDAGLSSSNSSRATTVNHDKKKKKKDPNYDYPDVHNLSKKSDYQRAPLNVTTPERPIYAEVGDLRKPDTPEYTSPDLIIKPRSGTEVVGVPGYQPPRGPFGDDTKSTYSSLGVLSSDDNSIYQELLDPHGSEKGKHPPPKYHVVEPEQISPEEEENAEIII